MELFFNALGLGLLNSIWQIAILYGLYKLLTHLLVQSPSARFRLGLLFTVLGSGFFLFSIIYFIILPNPTSIYAFESFFDSEISFFNRFIIFSGIGYTGLFLYALVKNVFHLFHFKNSLGFTGAKVPVAWRFFVQRQAAFMEIKCKVQVVCTLMSSPATYGWLKPVVLLPVSCLTGMDTISIEALLLHELAHIKRNDYLWHMMLTISETLLYPNPLMRMMIKETRLESEKACDNMVLQFGYPAPLYANALLHIAKSGHNHSVALAARGAGNLLDRMKNILSVRHSKKFDGRFLTMILFASGICFLAGISKFNIKAISDPEPRNFNISGASIFTPQEPKKYYPEDWKKKIQDTRLLIFNTRVGKLPATMTKTEKIIVKNNENSLAENINRVTPALKNNEIFDNEKVILPNPVFIDAGWAEKVTAEAMDITSPLFQSKELFTQLLEKLETYSKLEDKEWSKLLSLVSLYYYIGEQMYEEQHAVFSGLAASEIKQTQEVLVIMYDENNGLLTATKIGQEKIKALFNVDPNEAIPDHQQAILLHRKKDRTKAEVKL